MVLEALEEKEVLRESAKVECDVVELWVNSLWVCPLLVLGRPGFSI